MRYLPIEIDVTEEISLGSDCESGWEATPAIEFKTQATSNCSILADSDVATAGVGMCKGCISACHENIAKFHSKPGMTRIVSNLGLPAVDTTDHSGQGFCSMATMLRSWFAARVPK